MMFVRWKRRPAQSRKRPGYIRCAALVESYRDEHGKPRQRHIAYLGTIREGRETLGGWPIGFWQSADAALSALDLTPEAREAIEKALVAVVPKPDMNRIGRERIEAERSIGG